MANEYRVLRYYNTFFAEYGHKLQIKRKFLWKEYWITIENCTVAYENGREWAEHFDCEIVES